MAWVLQLALLLHEACADRGTLPRLALHVVLQATLPATWFITHYMRYQQYPGGFSAFALCQITIAQEAL